MNLQAKYNKSEFLNFLSNQLLSDDFIIDERPIKITETNYVKNASMLGYDKTIGVYVIEVEHNSSKDPRVRLTNELFKIAKGLGYNNVLAAVKSKEVPNYRFSLLTYEPKLKGSKINIDYSNPRRFSFLLGPDAKIKTPEIYLIKKKQVKDLEDLKSRFSLDVVNNNFFNEIAIKFTQLTGGKRGNITYDRFLKLPSQKDEKVYQNFAIRLIGRLVFCWFLKKKISKNGVPLMPDELLSVHAVTNNPNYYHEVLENLFFETLNIDPKERKLEIQNDLYNKVPYLNGGLFEPNDDFYGDSVSQPKNFGLKIPDLWFTNFFEILDSYNFTIDENTTLDAELSVDPEMLGRIFENLLAEINPETGDTARKALGSFYTPRQIVEYMVDESLKCFLKNELVKQDPTYSAIGESQADLFGNDARKQLVFEINNNPNRWLENEEKLDRMLDNLLSYSVEDYEITNEEKINLAKALDRIKILDPACGSGAFPMGILQKMLLILQKIDKDSKIWKANQLSRIEDYNMRMLMEEKLANENVAYIHKLGIIKNSIFGIDIQPIATEISRLRFFLSLIVDENINDEKENRRIEALPNLEFKFVTANSLIALDNQLEMFDLDDETSKLKGIRTAYFYSHGKRKKEIEAEFVNVQQIMAKKFLESGYKNQKVVQLINWKPFSHECTEWFDPFWMFGVEDGFDIIIGNPPYISAVTMKRTAFEKSKIKDSYPLVKGSYDIYILFLYKAVQLLNESGTYCWIIPNKFLIADYATATIDYLKKDCGLSYSLDVSIFKVFKNADIYPIIILGIKNLKDGYKEYYINQISDLSIKKLLDPKKLPVHITFKDYGIKIYSGTTGFQAHQVKNYLFDKKCEKSIPFIVSGNVDRFTYNNHNVRFMGTVYKEAYIKNNNIASSKWNFWNSPKIIVAGMTKVIEAVYTEEPVALGVGIYGIYHFEDLNPYYLTALLNCKYLTYYFQNKFRHKHLAGGYLAINKSTIEGLPLLNMDTMDVEKISQLSRDIHMAKRKDRHFDTSIMEEQIDNIVFKSLNISIQEINNLLNPINN